MRETKTPETMVTFRRIMLGAQDCLLFVPRAVVFIFTPTGDASSHNMMLEYGHAIRHMPQLFSRLAFRTRSLEEELDEVRCAPGCPSSCHSSCSAPLPTPAAASPDPYPQIPFSCAGHAARQPSQDVHPV